MSQIFAVLLIVNLLLIVVELPFTLAYLYYGFVFNENICPAWVIINYSLFILSVILTTWTSVERYLFIYHEHFIKRHSILLHYFPITFFVFYTPLLYVGLVILYPCQQAYTPYSYICGGPCYLFQIIPCLIDWLINALLVLALTCIMNLALIIRNVVQKDRMKRMVITAQRSQEWVRRDRSLSMIYTLLYSSVVWPN